MYIFFAVNMNFSCFIGQSRHSCTKKYIAEKIAIYNDMLAARSHSTVYIYTDIHNNYKSWDNPVKLLRDNNRMFPLLPFLKVFLF